MAIEIPEIEFSKDDIVIKLDSITAADYKTRWAPSQEFMIYHSNEEVGTLRFRFGQNRQVLWYAGHIGYFVKEEYRGHRFASKAVQAIMPYALQYYPAVSITCNPDNVASIKTIESIQTSGAGVVEYMGKHTIPKNNVMYKFGSREKQRYMVWPID